MQQHSKHISIATDTYATMEKTVLCRRDPCKGYTTMTVESKPLKVIAFNANGI
jgi:hypothetical protein